MERTGTTVHLPKSSAPVVVVRRKWIIAPLYYYFDMEIYKAVSGMTNISSEKDSVGNEFVGLCYRMLYNTLGCYRRLHVKVLKIRALEEPLLIS